MPLQSPIIITNVFCHPAPQRAKTEGVLPSSGLQEAEETQRGEEGGESTEEPPEE